MGKKLSKEIREWLIIMAVAAVLFTTGLYKDVASFLQRGILETGLLTPDISEVDKKASYDLLLKNLDGEKINLSIFKGQTVFINFWATWCPPCIAEMPDIHDLYDQMGQEVKFVMISLDEEPEKARRFIQRKEFEFPVYFLASGLPEVYQSSSIPTTFVISPDGRIVVEQYGLSKYDSHSFRKFLADLNDREESS